MPADPYPLDDAGAVVARVAALIRQAARGRWAPRPWAGPRLAEPVAHAVLQPQALLDSLTGPEADDWRRTPVGRIDALAMFAFQLGVCQGHALARRERDVADELGPAVEVVRRLKRGGDAVFGVAGASRPSALLFANGTAAYLDGAGEQVAYHQRLGWSGLRSFLATHPGARVSVQHADPLPPECLPWVLRHLRDDPLPRPEVPRG